MRQTGLAIAAFLALALSTQVPAATLGVNPPAEAVTAERITALPAAERAAWTAYLDRSIARKRADQAALYAELPPGQAPLKPSSGGPGPEAMPLDRSADWYASAEALRIADVIVSYQTPAGGWGKNQSRAGPPRQRGEPYVPIDLTRLPAPQPPGARLDESWTYVGTFDNGATIAELRFLAKVIGAAPTRSAVYRRSFLRGLDYILAAQMPNGGWPQVWPLQGGYHDAVTFNDDAMGRVLGFLDEVADGRAPYDFVPADLRTEARTASARGLATILKAQVVTNGRRTGWPQQVDPLTLAPTSARAYEPPAVSPAESTLLLVYLMALEAPSPEIVQAVREGVDWLKSTAIRDAAFETVGERGRRLVAKPGAPLLWARYYDLKTGRPIFGDRDRTLHDTVDDLSDERRNGYAWYGTGPNLALKRYEAWARAHPRP